LREAVDLAVKNGFNHTFKAEPTGLRCLETDKVFEPADVKIVGHDRFEGPSSEDDSAALYKIETTSGLKGTVVDAYGTYADEHLAEFLQRVRVEEN
jgi:hypothetical protein